MKRDWDLIRKILLSLEELPDTDLSLSSNELEDYQNNNVAYHMYIMEQAGLIEAICSKTLSGEMICMARMLTWEGQEFLSKIRQQSSWNKIKWLVKDKGLELSYETIKNSIRRSDY